ncbi:unnamed protein product [marine sediment metagenome]|uniref:PpiC domain-containing protein n=1 Tax=marine sediment metagenome TaxID=412755 RepID=X1DIY0_9ZZZZ
MMNFFRKHMRTIFLITIVGFGVGIFAGFGGYLFGDRTLGNAVAEVNGVKIPKKRYDNLFNQVMESLRDEETDITDELIKQKRQEVIQDLIQEEVFYQEGKKYGITVSDEELAANIHHFKGFQKDGRFNQQLYFQILAWRLRMTPREFEESQRRSIIRDKLREFIAYSVKITDKELSLEYVQRHNGNMKDFQENKDKFYEELRKEKIIAVFNEWYKSINNTIRIRVFAQQFSG